jgi:hypothetical protein
VSRPDQITRSSASGASKDISSALGLVLACTDSEGDARVRLDDSPQQASGLPAELSMIGSMATVGDQRFPLVRDGLVELSDFAHQIYVSDGPGAKIRGTEVDYSAIANVPTVDVEDSPVPADWPTGGFRGYGGEAATGVVDRGTRYLIDSSGQSYALGDPAQEVQSRLGYADITPALVPQSWVKLFRGGPALDPAQARLAVGDTQ